MTTETQTALSLERIVASKVKMLLRRRHLNRDIIIGLIGDRGSGKSLGAAQIALFDWGVEPGETIRSNMAITADIEVSDEYAARYGVDGGKVHYQSKQLDKFKFLTFDDEYFKNIFVIDEINIFLADARRAMSNENLYTNDVGQQLRKLQSPLIYTCISEMFVDTRIRDITDIFIKTEDTALTELGLARKQQQGVEFRWYIYPMTTKLFGVRYAETNRKLGPIYMRGNRLWKVIDTNEMQLREKVNFNKNMHIQADKDEATNKFNQEYGWVGEKLIKLADSGVRFLTPVEIKQYLPGVPKSILKDNFEFEYDTYSNKWYFGAYVDTHPGAALV